MQLTIKQEKYQHGICFILLRNIDLFETFTLGNFFKLTIKNANCDEGT